MTTEQAAAYFPHGLKCKVKSPIGTEVIETMLSVQYCDIELDYCRIHNGFRWVDSKNVKPILHPLSDITKTITVNGKSFVPLDQIMSHDIVAGRLLEIGCKISNLPYWVVENLIAWHIDIFNLIESGQAIDVNTLETNPYE